MRLWPKWIYFIFSWLNCHNSNKNKEIYKWKQNTWTTFLYWPVALLFQLLSTLILTDRNIWCDHYFSFCHNKKLICWIGVFVGLRYKSILLIHWCKIIIRFNLPTINKQECFRFNFSFCFEKKSSVIGWTRASLADINSL